jgi:hypothetical protein
VHATPEWLDLFEECFGKLVTSAFRNRRNIVNWFVGLQLRALTARLPDRINDLCFKAKKTQLKDLEQSTGPCSNNDDVSFDHGSTPSELRHALS